MPTLHFPPQATALAKALALQEHLWQRPQVQGVTIDGPDSRDLDDAIWIEPTATGAILSVHIADVAELVTPGSVLDKVAIARTQTRYFGKGNDPMLPRALSEDKLSLLEHQARPTLTVRVTLDQNAQIQKTELFESWLRSSKRFNYRDAEAALTDLDSPFHERLSHAQQWAERLYHQRLEQGAIGGRITQLGWLNEEGSLVSGEHTNSHLLIQEFMILANRAVAEWLAERDIPALYRNHTARAIAPDRETMYQTLLTLGSGVAIRQRLASWLNRADYGPALIGHFALNLPAYCHFTSPIRRLADLINHRIVKAQLRGQDLPYSKTELEQLGQHIDQVTRDLEQKTSDFFKGKHQEQYKAQVQSSENLQALSEKEFSRVLKYAIESQELEADSGCGAFTPELTSRLESRSLPLVDLYCLLFQSGHEDLQWQAYGCLQENAQDAASVISMAIAQQESWESFEYVELSQSQTPPFHSWLEVRANDKVLTTVYPSAHQRKQSARHLACLSWIEAYLQEVLVSPEQRIKLELLEPMAMVQPVAGSGQEMSTMHPEVTAVVSKPNWVHRNLSKSLKDGQPFVSLLLEVSQGLHLSSPEFEFHEEAGYFVCMCRFEGLNQHFVGEGSATKKQRAKHLAARAVLEKLQGLTAQKGGEWEAGA
jgi:ribonuclease R